jgi:hypothetical protein
LGSSYVGKAEVDQLVAYLHQEIRYSLRYSLHFLASHPGDIWQAERDQIHPFGTRIDVGVMNHQRRCPLRSKNIWNMDIMIPVDECLRGNGCGGEEVRLCNEDTWRGHFGREGYVFVLSGRDDNDNTGERELLAQGS